MKKFIICVLLNSLLPLLCITSYAGGIASDFCIAVFVISLAFYNFMSYSKLLHLVILDLIMTVFSTFSAFVCAQLYLRFVSDDAWSVILAKYPPIVIGVGAAALSLIGIAVRFLLQLINAKSKSTQER